MIEKGKSLLLAVLVVLSLVQSYMLAYSTPYMDAKEKSEFNYVKAEPLGDEETVENLIFPEQLVLHMGDDKHTVFFPGTKPYYDLILLKLSDRAFKGIQLGSYNSVDWDQVRREDKGVELRFARAIPFDLLQRVFRIDGDFLFSGDSIDKIWIYASKGRDEVRTFFFSADGRNVYEALRADLTPQDVEGYVGFGQYWDSYSSTDGQVYVPDQPVSRIFSMQIAYNRYSIEQIKENLFTDPGTTKTIQDNPAGPQYYTDSKRGLKIEPDSGWMSFTDTVAPTTTGENDYIDNVLSAISFINQHGGWNGKHALSQEVQSDSASIVRFQQYYNEAPILSGSNLRLGYMQLAMQQGVVSSYERSLLVLGDEVTNKAARQLPGGDVLRKLINQVRAPGRDIESLFPAYRPVLKDDKLTLMPVWGIRFRGGEVEILTDSIPAPAK
ncbi:YycH family regulatory protein [Cohnella panacarvi]|uniref:YycH family regulatory protein n=1 Tax=Cohnella panacarvi TaxID=400776 RepID=UPI00047CDB1D|nr:two-component system activity regulator YycH [Cohnella panacarvi]